jgi:molybdopterin-guanine dinucleotide biosynthesis protein
MNSRKPFIIGIGGAHSSCGKTTLASAIIRYLAEGGPFVPLGANPRIAAIKYTKEAVCSSIIEDDAALHEKGKDTGRLSSAGADKVLWLKAPAEALGQMLPAAMQRLTGFECIVIEGNSAVELAEPDIVIFITGRPHEPAKASAARLFGRADIIVSTHAGSRSGAAWCLLKDFPATLSGEELRGIIDHMENTAKKKEITALLMQRAGSGRLTCTEARKIAEELKVSYAEVGSAANDLKIKIRNCELGCF